MWMLANPIMSSTLDVLKDSVYARRNGLNFVYLDVALVSSNQVDITDTLNNAQINCMMLSLLAK